MKIISQRDNENNLPVVYVIADIMNRSFTIILLTILSFLIKQTYSQDIVKLPGDFENIASSLKPTALKGTYSIDTIHYLIQRTDSTTWHVLRKQGWEIVKIINPYVAIGKPGTYTLNKSAVNNSSLQAMRTVSYRWKLSDTVLPLAEEVVHNFTLKTIRPLSRKEILTLFESNVSVTPVAPDIYQVNTTLRMLLSHAIMCNDIQYIGLEDYIPHEESRVHDLNLSPNTINQIHHYFPLLSGEGMTLSLKEQQYIKDDVDLAGRHKDGGIGAATTSNHATDMATIAAGAGNSFITGKGVAFESQLTSSDFANLYPDDISYYEGMDAWVQNHSYGTSIENFYGTQAEAYDAMAYQHPTLLFVFSSGNRGGEAATVGTYQNITGFANLTSHAKMAKNILTVGAVDTTGHVLNFSSRGPVYDGRIKPELVAYSMQGTSNAAALVSGTAVVLQQAYKEQQGHLPPAALVKGVLINSARDVAQPGPDFTSGFGNVDAYRALQTLQAGHYFTGTVSQGEHLSFPLAVPAGSQRLKVTLLWNDPAATVAAATALVNDLDLTLTQADETWLPWRLDTAANATSLHQPAIRGADHINTIEQITLDLAEGNYQLHVTGTDVGTSQNFYVVYQWDEAPQFSWQFPTGGDNVPYDGETSTYLYWHSTLSAHTGRLEYSTDQGITWTLLAPAVNLAQGYYRWPADEIPTTFASDAIARMVVENEAYTSEAFTLSRPLTVSVGFLCQDSVDIQWAAQPGATAYTVFGYINQTLQPVITVQDTAWIFTRDQYPTEQFSVTPVFHNLPGIRSQLYNYTNLGTACFFYSFYLRSASSEGIHLVLNLGTPYGIDQILFEHLTDDGFETIGTLTAGKSKAFNFLHTAPQQGYNAYRTKLITLTGETIISDTVQDFYLTEKPFLIFPNPILTAQTLQVYTQEFANPEMTFSLFNREGKELMHRRLYASRNVFLLTEGLSTGLYIYRIQYEGGVYQGKLVVLAND